MNLRRSLGRALLVATISVGGVIVAPRVVEAISGCTYWTNPQVCVWASTGTKQPGRQWVGEVRGSAVSSTLGIVEIWGDGFYKIKSNVTAATWQIGKWVASGTYICSRFTWTNQWNQGGRGPVACIRINSP